MKPHHKANAVKLGERVKFYREQKQMTHQVLARECGCSTKTIGRIENGTTNTGYFVLVDMCRVFEITLEQLMKGI